MKKIILLIICFFISNIVTTASAQPLKPSEIYAKNVNSVLFVKTQDSTGSGFIVKEDGTFVTCFHVIANADHITVKMNDGSFYNVNGYKYLNPQDDVAILTLDTTRKFKPVIFNSENSMRVGETIYAISNPIGIQFVFSDGMINQFNKKQIQFSAPISSGSSGGPLLNKDGKLLGLISSQLNPAKTQNINFAISNSVFIPHVNDSPVVNNKKLLWTDFVVSNMQPKELRNYTRYISKHGNYVMFYKYINPFAVKYEKIMPEEFYPFLGYMALYAAVESGFDELYVKESVRWYAGALKKQQNLEATLVALHFIFTLNGDDAALDYADKALHKIYPKTYKKLNKLYEQLYKCDDKDDDCIVRSGVEILNFLDKLTNLEKMLNTL